MTSGRGGGKINPVVRVGSHHTVVVAIGTLKRTSSRGELSVFCFRGEVFVKQNPDTNCAVNDRKAVMKLQTKRESRSAFPTAGEVFSDGTVIGLLRDQGCPRKLTLVRYHDGILDTKSEMPFAERVYAPVSLDPSVAKAIRFPSRVAPPETTTSLFTDAYEFLNSHLGQLDQCTTAMVFAIFATWLTPVLPAAPILSIFVPPGGPKKQVLQVLNLMCRRSLRLVGLNRTHLSRVPMFFQPTLLLDEPDPKLQSILSASAERGAYISQAQGVVEFFGPKIIVSRKMPLESDALRAALIPLTGQVPFLAKENEEKIAEEFQARFLGYFLRNAGKVSTPAFDVNKLSSPMLDLALTFGSAIIGDKKLQRTILPLLNVQDEEIRADRALSDDAVLLEALIYFNHEGDIKVRIGPAAEKACSIFKGRGSDKKMSPESAGWAIKRPGIPSGRLDRAGNGVELNEKTCRLIHKLALSHGVRAMDGAFLDCAFCRELAVKI